VTGFIRGGHVSVKAIYACLFGHLKDACHSESKSAVSKTCPHRLIIATEVGKTNIKAVNYLILMPLKCLL